jgi:hypothetical protein
MDPLPHETTNPEPARELPDIPGVHREWIEEFEAARRRSLEERFRYAFIKTYKPVMDDASFRAFDTMEDYRRWCDENLAEWLGYRRLPREEREKS